MFNTNIIKKQSGFLLIETIIYLCIFCIISAFSYNALVNFKQSKSNHDNFLNLFTKIDKICSESESISIDCNNLICSSYPYFDAKNIEIVNKIKICFNEKIKNQSNVLWISKKNIQFKWFLYNADKHKFEQLEQNKNYKNCFIKLSLYKNNNIVEEFIFEIETPQV